MGMRFSPGMDIFGYVIVGKELSNGANATSYKAQDKDGGYVFLKNYKSPSCRVSWYNDYIAYQNELKRRIEQSEILTGQTCRFLKFFEYRNSEGVSSYCQTFEFLEGGENLKTLLENSELTWLQRFTFAKLLMTGIRCLHKAGIIHADLKPDNIYLIPDDDIETKYSFRIIDFDRSLLSDRTAPWDGMEGYAGTPRYFSPEHTGKRIPSEASDVFTAGIILCELLSRNGHPFSSDWEEYENQITSFQCKPFVLRGSSGSSAKDALLEKAIGAALNPMPEKRPTAAQLHEILKGKLTALTIPISGTLILLGPEKQSIRINVSSEIGREVLKANGFGDETRFCASSQFFLQKEDNFWKIIPKAETPNTTLLNGTVLKSSVSLNVGDVISIGSNKSCKTILPMTVI